MRKLLLATVALAALALPAQAAIIKNLGVNPASSQGNFSNSVGGATFEDQYTFQLVGSPQFLTFSSATNVFTNPTDFITNFQGALYTTGLDGIVNNGDDVLLGGPTAAVPCPTGGTFCQVLAGSALLGPGSYYLEITGIGGGTSGYGGNLTTAPVGAVPIPGMALAVPLGAIGLAWAARRRRKAA